MAEPKWNTGKYKKTHYVCLIMLVVGIGIDIWLAVAPDWKTISQYVQVRAEDQPLFGYICAGVLIWLIFHWFIEKKLKH